jgi:hypothetical protein
LSSFNEVRIFWTDFDKSPPIQNLTKIRPAGVQLLHADGQTADVTKLIGAFRDLCERTTM